MKTIDDLIEMLRPYSGEFKSDRGIIRHKTQQQAFFGTMCPLNYLNYKATGNTYSNCVFRTFAKTLGTYTETCEQFAIVTDNAKCSMREYYKPQELIAQYRPKLLEVLNIVEDAA